MRALSWKLLVQLSQAADERAIEELLRRLSPVITRIAGRLASGTDTEETILLAQEAVWCSLVKIDTTRADSTIRACLVTVAANAIRDAKRADNKRRPTPFSVVFSIQKDPSEEYESSIDKNNPPPSLDTLRAPDREMPSDGIERTLPNRLKEYLTYVRTSATIQGAHQAIAKKHGISPTRAALEFREHARRYILNCRF